MASVLAELQEKARSLSPIDKAALIRVLIDALDGPTEAGVEEAWIVEAKRRHQELLDGRVKGVPAEKVFEHVRVLLAR
jgi:putative addiction module component (TIGR02574 family)